MPWFAWIAIVAILVYGVSEGVQNVVKARNARPPGMVSESEHAADLAALESKLKHTISTRDEEIAQLRGRIEEQEYRLATVEKFLREARE
ncbi:hypothetical protein [Serinibacter salmoneus]|uniref:Uncharacterized protein n=1 Tax=Serinibacter salmoneus TaxID=556530 RepID=A0A2A9D560_9MICO|nr:hypothetical protein [Serinibacter salmoneus]PFG21092.1 hypothetical protein ATL40_2712 [Serinibacter salmoneus]